MFFAKLLKDSFTFLFIFCSRLCSTVCDDRCVRLHGRADEFPGLERTDGELRLLLRGRLGGLPHDVYQRPHVFSATQAQVDTYNSPPQPAATFADRIYCVNMSSFFFKCGDPKHCQNIILGGKNP